MVALQRAQINNTPIDDILPADTNAGPSGFDVWVNALWFTSLTLSLGTALMAVLVKQWLYQYMLMISGTARDRSLIRFYRFEGLQKWHVLTIIGTLPIVLHIALGLFLAGLVVFLIPLNISLACVVGFITLIVYALYAVSNILPVIYVQCPYRTPFSDILNVLLRPVRALPSLMMVPIYKLLHTFGRGTTSNPMHPEYKRTTLKEMERLAATNDEVAEEVAWRALLWLYQMTSNPPTKRIIQESLGCLPDDVFMRSVELQADLERTLAEITPSVWDNSRRSWFRSIPSGQVRRVERILRAVRNPFTPSEGHVPDAPWRLDTTDTKLSFGILISILAYAPSMSVETDSVRWNLPSLLRHLINEQYSPAPILLPPHLWTQLIASIPSKLEHYDDDFLARLCNIAVQTFGITQSTIPPPFPGPVPIRHKTIPLLQRTTDILVRHLGVPRAQDSFEIEPLTSLFTIYDYAASESNFDFNTATARCLGMLMNIWSSTSHLDIICRNDKSILCRRAENIILQMTITDDWWGNQDEGKHCICYRNVLAIYYQHDLANHHTDGSELFKKLLFDLSLSLTKDRLELSEHISTALYSLVALHGHREPVYSLLVCASPFLSTRTLTSYRNCICYIYPVVSMFVYSAQKMYHDINLQGLLAEPQRLYTICWILALGGSAESYDMDWEEHRRETLLRLACIDPTHVVWESRAHYMETDPRDWPYLRLLDKELEEEAIVERVKKKMNDCLQILDEFFASLSVRFHLSFHLEFLWLIAYLIRLHLLTTQLSFKFLLHKTTRS